MGWRWCFWVQFILSAVLGLAWFIIPETFHKKLLREKAKRLHLESKVDTAYVEENPRDRFRNSMFRPIQMLFLDPIVFFSSLYVSFIFGIMYLFFAVSKHSSLPGEPC